MGLAHLAQMARRSLAGENEIGDPFFLSQPLENVDGWFGQDQLALTRLAIGKKRQTPLEIQVLPLQRQDLTLGGPSGARTPDRWIRSPPRMRSDRMLGRARMQGVAERGMWLQPGRP